METDHSDQSSNESTAERRKFETVASTSSKLEVNDDCPILMLPDDILAKIIAYVPIAQWPALELLYDFREATLIAWRQLRNVDVEREFLIKFENAIDRSSFGASLVSFLGKLVERSPFLTSIRGIDLQSVDAGLISDAFRSLAEFEHLQYVTIGNARSCATNVLQSGVPLESVVEFLESTLSRSSLKGLHLFDVEQREEANCATMLNRFASSFATGRGEIHLSLKLEKFTFSTSNHWRNRSLYIRLDTLDTTRLIDVRLGNASIEPDHLTALVERALNLNRVDLSFLACPYKCTCTRLQANKKLLSTLAAHENLTTIKFDSRRSCGDCNGLHFKSEFIEMLKTIGNRGKMRKLALKEDFVSASFIDMENVCATISDYIPYLQSISLYFYKITHGNLFDLGDITELREIDIKNHRSRKAAMSSASSIFAPLPHLERLFLNCFEIFDPNSLKALATTTTLMDVRIPSASSIRTDVYETWSEGIASSLQVLMLGGIGYNGWVSYEEGLVRLLSNAVRLRVNPGWTYY